MRITCIISSLSSGGAERVMSIIANYWSANGKEITIITYRNEKIYPVFYKLDKRIQHKNIYHQRKFFSIIKFFFRLRYEIKLSSPDVAISFMDESNVLTILSTIGARIPVIISERNNTQKYKPSLIIRVLRSITYPFAKRMVNQTSNIQESFPVKLWKKMVVIPNPVVKFENNQIKPDFILQKPAIFAMGSLTHQKRFDLIIKIFVRIMTQFPPWHLYIFGDGPQRKDLETLINTPDLRERIHLPGITRTSGEVMKQADIFILSSRFEGFPNVLCEAMMLGLPVISFDCAFGPSEIVKHNKNGILVENGNQEEMQKAIQMLIQDPKKRKDLGDNAKKIINKFGIDRVMPLWNKVLYDTIEGK